MPMMARMRDLAPAFIITVGALFVLFMVISDSNVLEALGARSNNVGSINGEDITYQDFSTTLERARENQKAQTGQDIDENSMDGFRDQVWEALVTQTLTQQKMEEYGLSVSDKEIRDLILGENPPEFLKKNFIDSTGKFNREVYESALMDARNKEALIQAEELVRQQLLGEKLQHLLNATIMVSEAEIKRKFFDQNGKMTADYVFIDINSFPDSSIKVTDDEVKDYYNDHPEKFKVEDQRKLKYVTFNVVASKADSNLVLQNLNNVLEKVKEDTGSFKSWVDTYSEVPYSSDTLDITQMPKEIAEVIGQYQPGSVIGPLFTSSGGVLYNYINKADGKETFVRASHILISASDNDSGKGLQEANRIYNELIGGANFSDYAVKYSKDPGSASAGGDLGWFGKGRMVPEFEEACFKGEVGVIQKPVKTSFGYHIIKVTGRSNSRYVFEKIINSVKPSASTRDDIFQQASDFAYLADKNGFEITAEQEKYAVKETPEFNKDTYSIEGIGYNSSIVKFAFDNGQNTISPVFKTANGYVVFKISEVIKPGVKKFETVEKDVKALVIREKKFEKAKNIITDIKKKINGDLTKATSVNSLARFNTASGFTTNGSIAGIGLDYNFAATAFKLPLNKVSDPVKGQRGYYLINVKEKTKFDSVMYGMQRDILRDNIYTEKKQAFFNQWLQKLKEDAEIEDKRYMFFDR